MRFMFVSPSFFAHNTGQPEGRLHRRKKNRARLEKRRRLWYAYLYNRSGAAKEEET
jgi:hypothetical protein